MDVGIGLPNAVPRTTGAHLVEWARRAGARGFNSLGTIDRVIHDNYEPLIALAAAAAVRRESDSAYESAGCDELVLFPSSGDPDQVDLLADAIGL